MMANKWEGPRKLVRQQKANRKRYVPEPFLRHYVCTCGRTVARGVLAGQAGAETYTCKICRRKREGR